MAKRFITPFAEAGDRAIMPDTPTGTDSNYQTGYPSQYGEDPAVNPTTAKFVERDKSNQLYNDITANIKEWQEHSYPAFITSAVNGGVPFAYKKNSIVTYLGIDYVSVVDGNEDVPPSSKWAIHSALINDLSQAYEFSTVAEYKAFPAEFPAGKVIHLLDRGAEFTVITGTGTSNNLNIIASDQVAQSVSIDERQVLTFEMLGGLGDGVFDNTVIASLGFTLELSEGGEYLITSAPDISKLYGAGKLKYNSSLIDVPATADFTSKLNSSIDRFFDGRSVDIEVNRYDPQIVIQLDAADTGDANDWSLRESAFIFYEPTRVWYLLCDAVNLDSPYYPNTYDTEIHLFKCTDVESLKNWDYLGVAIEKGGVGELGEFGVASCSGAATWLDGRIYAPFSARNNGAPSFDGRSIGLAYSNSNPETLPWNKVTNAVVDTAGEDDDPACVFIAGDSRLHIFNRSTSPYRIVHSASLTPRDPSSWSAPNTAASLFSAGTTAIELTSVFVLDGTIHLYGMEQGPGISGIKISDWQSADPDIEFVPANSGDRFISDNEINQPINLYAGGHFNVAIREGVVRGVFHTYTFGGSRYTLKGNTTVQNPRKELPSPVGLFRARMQAPQSIPSGVTTKVGVTDDLDPYNWFISSRYTPQIEGWYEFEAMVNMVASAAGAQMIVEVRRNNTRVCHLCFLHGSSTSAIGGGGKTPPIEMNGTTDYIELFVFQNTGGNVDISGDTTSSYFSGKLIGK